MASEFVGLYRASSSDCIKSFASTPRAALDFPVRVSLECDLCSRTHSFSLTSTVVMATPRQAKGFLDHCAETGVETSVEVP